MHFFVFLPMGSKCISHIIAIVVSLFIFPNQFMGQFKVCVCAMSDLMPRRLVKLVFLSSKFAALTMVQTFQQNGADVNNTWFTEYIRSNTKIAVSSNQSRSHKRLGLSHLRSRFVYESAEKMKNMVTNGLEYRNYGYIMFCLFFPRVRFFINGSETFGLVTEPNVQNRYFDKTGNRYSGLYYATWQKYQLK